MADPLEELIRQNTEFHSRLIAENNELDRAFQSGAFGQLVYSWSNKDGRGSDGSGADSSSELEGETGSNMVEGKSGGTSGGIETGGDTVQ
tara:strand:+ start:76871 stop:77140 length:270 start_codon:yes stop_codon:yes gene_type:complete